MINKLVDYRELSLKEIQEYELEMMKAVHLFLVEHNIPYYMLGGSILGAVRHKGFIPWDDDLDVLMLRDDFEKMLKLFKDDRYRVVKAEDKSIFPYLFVRIEDSQTKVVFENKDKHSSYNGGVCVDVLPIDNFPDDPKEFKKLKRRIYIYSNFYRAKTRKQLCKSLGIVRNIIFVITKLFLLPIPKRYFRNKLFEMMTRYNNVETKNKGYWTNYWHDPWIFPSTAFEGFTQMEFEGRDYSVLKNYDAYLRSEYGDYMQLPPASMQIARHGFKAYYLNK